MEEPDSPAYFAQFRTATDAKISDYSVHFEVFEKTAVLKNKMLAQRILETGHDLGHVRFVPVSETGSLFDDAPDLVHLNLLNVLKSKEAVRLAFIKEHHQKIFDMFTKFEEKNARTVGLLSMVILKTLPFAVVSEEGNLSAAERISLIFISSLKSLAEALRQQRLSAFTTQLLQVFISLYETVVEPVALPETWNDHVALNYLAAKLQNYCVDFAAIYAEFNHLFDLQLRTSLLYLVGLALTYDKRYFEERIEGPINPSDFTFFKSRKREVGECLKSLIRLLPSLKKLDFATIRRLAKAVFYLREFVAESDTKMTLTRLMLDTILCNSGQGVFKLCFPQIVGRVAADLSLGADEYTDKLLTQGFRSLRDGFGNDNLAALSIHYLLVLCERGGMDRLVQAQEVFRQGSRQSESSVATFHATLFLVFTFYAVQTNSGLFFKNNFDIFSDLLKAVRISSFIQVGLIRLYLEQLLTEIPDELIAYLGKHKLAAVDLKEQTLYFLTLTTSILKFKYSPESMPENLVEVVRTNIMEYNKLLTEDPKSPKLGYLRLFYSQVRKFCLRIEKAFPAQFQQISGLLKNFCLNQKEEYQGKHKKTGTIFKLPTGECEIVPTMLIFAPQYSCPETGSALTTLLLLSSQSAEPSSFYLTNNNCTRLLFPSQFKISPVYEVTGIADPIQFNLEVLLTNGGLFIRLNLFNASPVLIKDLVVTVTHTVDKYRHVSDTIPIDNFPPASKKNFNLKFNDADHYDFRIDSKIQVQKIDYQERNLLQEEKEGDNNRIEDSFGSDDEMNRVYTINCQQVTVPLIFFFLRTAADPRDAFAITLARKSFHLKFRIEVEFQSPLLASLAEHLCLRLEKADFTGLFRHFSQATFFLLQLTFVQEREKGVVRERVLLRAKTHSRKVAREFKRLFDIT